MQSWFNFKGSWNVLNFRKQVVVLTARVHPGEAPCSWIMRGIIDFLVGDTDVARELRARFIFKVSLTRYNHLFISMISCKNIISALM